jgi:lipid-A-disaccharide synthase-like uncharacterized protein
MSDVWRELIYPLGYLSSIAFAGRFLLQWVSSEIHRKSMVTRSFWRLSLVGNVLLLIHAFFQLQFHVCIIQACNAVISWRNLNLMEDRSRQVSFLVVIKTLIAIVGIITCGFLLQGWLSASGKIEWFRLPTVSLDDPTPLVGPIWHAIGFLGLILFSSRFWVQWWLAEKQSTSSLGLVFWWLSISGGLLTLIYFVKIDDPVNIIGPAVGLIPYIRNLMLIHQEKNRPQLSAT